MELTEFAKNFKGYPISRELLLLNSFEDQYPDYSEGFCLLVDDQSGLKTWSENEEFLNRLMPFAQANRSDSMYALWNDGTNKPLDQLPVVVLGDEGGVHILAENTLQLMQLLTFDAEIAVGFDWVYFYKDEDDYQESPNKATYQRWLKENFSLDPVQDPNAIIEAAQNKHKAAFDHWFGQYATPSP
jgi:hypothetical protein